MVAEPDNHPGPALGPSLADLRAAYQDGSLTPEAVVEQTLQRIAERAADHAWITVTPRQRLLDRARALVDEAERAGGSEHLPLFGVPLGVKDSIDVAGLPTSNGCPAYTTTPGSSATAVQRLIQAGGIVVGKTNLDQFATGLVGTRSPYGRGESVYGQGIVSGGSSSGSALAVARGVVPVAVATDTAGSGRVPAALNGIVGIKPTRGLVSTVGLVPACRTLDCVTVMGGRLDDALTLLAAICGPDPANPWDRPASAGPVLTARGAPSRPRIGLPAPAGLDFFGDQPMASAHLAARAQAVQVLGGDPVEVDLTPFTAAGELLYQGPWVAERTAEFGRFILEHPGAVLPVVEQIIMAGARYSAVDAFAAGYRLQALRHQVQAVWRDLDAILVPTVGTTYTMAEVDADPLGCNARLGRYTQFGNLLDLAGIALPLGVTPDGRPLGITLLGPAGSDLALAGLAARLLGEPDAPSPELLAALIAAGALAPGGDPQPHELVIAVAGRHLTGGSRNAELVALGGRLVRTARTAPAYQLFLLPPEDDPLPALVSGGRAQVEVELWALPSERLGGLLLGVPAPLGLGRLQLADGSDVLGFLADGHAVRSATAHGQAVDISASGGWRQHSTSRTTRTPASQRGAP